MPALAPREFEFLGMRAVVASPRMLETLELAGRVARTNATVLIHGESGCGKEVVARSLHQLSLRCNRPWVDVSCGALPEHLMESELFGYEKGAFSGAAAAKPGLFELAHLGTLFLDEVGELEPKMQVKLLRVLDSTPYYRLGGTRKITVDVRVLAATNADLELAVAAGRFRRDLYHRLSQMTLRVPPLRERPEDILALAAHFLTLHDGSMSFTGDALDALCRYPWPGNVRELRNIVTRAAILSRDGIICRNDLGFAPALVPAPLSVSSALVPGPESIEPSPNLDAIERQAILNVLGQTDGHRQRAAELLGISRRTLSRKLRQYRLDDQCPEETHAARNWSQGSVVSGKTA
ncbi:MAG: sigma-54-dependent Fis family transcriptional regulator [Candidatus Solibacter usitatus]|nr:sigma-54-dependent Fis family transcriptional regulator [Candidatus Solibacter usitatus]